MSVAELERAFARRGVVTEWHRGQTNVFFPGETRFTKCTVLCRVGGRGRVCVVPEFEDALAGELVDAGMQHDFTQAVAFKIRQRRVLLTDAVPDDIAARVCQAAWTWRAAAQ